MKPSPLISVVLVTYNAQETLQECLDSICNQEYQRIEIIVVDGASTDNTVSILQQNEKKLAFWISEKDQGIYHAMNKALGYVKGEWIYFIGADDTLTWQFTLLLAELKNPNAIYYASVNKAGKKYLGKLSDYQQAKTGINHQAIIYPAKLFSKYRYDIRYKISADHVLNMACRKEFPFVFKDYIIANYSDMGLSSRQKDTLFESEKARLILKYFGLITFLRFQFKLLKQKWFK